MSIQFDMDEIRALADDILQDEPDWVEKCSVCNCHTYPMDEHRAVTVGKRVELTCGGCMNGGNHD